MATVRIRIKPSQPKPLVQERNVQVRRVEKRVYRILGERSPRAR